MAGFPPGVVNIITGFGEPCGRIITSHPKVARVAFTGGSDVAKHIVKNTAENLIYQTEKQLEEFKDKLKKEDYD